MTKTINREEFISRNPEFPWLRIDAPREVESFLRTRGWISADEHLQQCAKPGDGNMNLTIRVVTDRRSMILKQSRPWVEKYDQIPAPWNRIEFEHRFYQRVSAIPDVASRMPQLLLADMHACVLMLDDLGDAEALTTLYSGESLQADVVHELASFLGALHASTTGSADSAFENLEMRLLNHQHIFQIPLQRDNGLDLENLETGLSAAADRLRDDQAYRTRLEGVGQRYLQTGTVLLHGDYFPGSWLRTGRGIFVIDPEFCFFGEPEIDLGCALAHFRLSNQSRQHAQSFLNSYTKLRPGFVYDSALLSGFAAAEVMRRLIGVAQLPLPDSPGRRTRMIEQSRQAMIHQVWEQLWD